MSEIINPFKHAKKIDWKKRSQERLAPVAQETNIVEENNISEKSGKLGNPGERVAKSFKIFKGKLSRDFDKRVNKLQVHFDDLDSPKNYIDSGKYIMFLMAFAEKYGLYELYKEVDGDGNLELPKQKILNHFSKN